MSDRTDWGKLVENAIEKRKTILEDSATDCLRIFHGYEEGCTGVVVEKFGPLLVINHKIPFDEKLEGLTEQLDKHLEVETIVTKAHQSLRLPLKHSTVVRKGELGTADIECVENGVKYDIKAQASHNIGLYLDTREARKWIKANSEGRRILNLFAFTGSLGLCAQVGGAKEVVHLDKSAELLPRLKTNYELNGLKWDNRSFLQGDIYKHLPRAKRAGKKFGGIILDPPPKVYASSHASDKPRGQDFGQLVGLCSELLSEDGWLMCFFHRFDRSREDFEQEVLANSKVDLKIERRFTSGEDFPESNPEHKLRVSVFKVQS